MRLRTHHKRKQATIRRKRAEFKKFEAALLRLTGEACLQSAMTVFVKEFTKAMSSAIDALFSAFAATFTPKRKEDADKTIDELYANMKGHMHVNSSGQIEICTSLPDFIPLDAEPFWDEWPEII